MGSGATGWEPLLGRTVGGWSRASVDLAVAGRRVLITGAGGSIGAALARAIQPAAHAGLVLLDHSEQAAYQLAREFGGSCDPVLGDAGDPELLAALFRGSRCPQVVFHAAAFKHVPLLEANAFAAVTNNVFATDALLRAAEESAGCERFVLVSTDKAVAPHSVMGASKRIAELLVLASAGSGRAGWSPVAVRLGNVLGSQGSVVPLLREQLAAGRPLTVTHAEARRFFLSIDETVAALLVAAASELPGIAVPEMGAPVRVLDLARHLAGEYGRLPEQAATIVFTGLRPGDKMEESLLSAGERWGGGAGLRRVASLAATADRRTLAVAVEGMRQAVERRDLAELLEQIRRLAPEYKPSAELLARVDRAGGTGNQSVREESRA